jgi:hypothetical protein
MYRRILPGPARVFPAKGQKSDAAIFFGGGGPGLRHPPREGTLPREGPAFSRGARVRGERGRE